MARQKRGPALFEVIKRERGGGPIRRRLKTALLDRSDPPSSTGVPPESGDAAASSPDSQPLVEVAGERIHFSFTQWTASIAVAVAGAVLGVTCYLGYYVGDRRGEARGIQRGKRMAQLEIQGSVEDEIDQARRSMVTRNLFDGIGEDPTVAIAGTTAQSAPAFSDGATGDPIEATDVPWVPGHNYIVAQNFKADARADALDSQGFLRQNGVQTIIVKLKQSGPYGYRLITVAGFNLDDPVQKRLADEHLKKVRRIGEAYSEGGGRYDFQSAYFMKLTSDRW